MKLARWMQTDPNIKLYLYSSKIIHLCHWKGRSNAFRFMRPANTRELPEQEK